MYCIASAYRLYHYQWFLCATKEQALVILQWPTRMSEPEYIAKCMEMAGGKGNMVRLLVPSFDWTLNIVVVSEVKMKEICESIRSQKHIRLNTKWRYMLFIRQDKSISLLNGVTVSSWVKGNPQVSATRSTYEYVSQYKATYGSGYS